MNADLYARWVEALRSCPHAYGRDCLRPTAGGWTPIGLLADAIDPGGWKQSAKYGHWLWHDMSCGLTAASRDAAGITVAAMQSLVRLQSDSTSFVMFADRLPLVLAPVAGPAFRLATQAPTKPARGRRR